jgi:4-amino-4-deoxy-L-arabinose transferase-like glycosyltransferase
VNTIARRIPYRESLALAGILVLALAVRLIKISQPYVDDWSFKQGTIAMIAENFYRNGFNIFYPQINWAGNSAGYIGTEFPLVPFLASVLYLPFGVHEWIGRSVSVAFSLLALPFFYFLVRKIASERSALFAAVIYALAPLSIFASRSFMSDMTSLGFSIIALYLFSEWLDRSHERRLLFAAGAATALAILVKAPAVIIGLPLLYMAWEQYRWKFIRDPRIWLFAGVSIVFPVAWYSHAYYITLTYPPHQFAGSDGLRLEELHFYTSVGRRLVGSSLTPFVAVGMLAGLFLPPVTKYGRLFYWWLVAICFFIVIAGFGNRHPWYQLPVVPVAAAFAGQACDFVLRRIRGLTQSRSAELFSGAALVLTLLVVSYNHIKPLYDPWAAPLREAGHQLDRIASPDALAVFVVEGDSSGIYYGKRKGWHAFDDSNWGAPLDSAQAIRELEKLRKRGATHLVFTQYTAWWLDYYNEFGNYLDLRYRRVEKSPDYVIFELSGGLIKRANAGVAQHQKRSSRRVGKESSYPGAPNRHTTS